MKIVFEIESDNASDIDMLATIVEAMKAEQNKPDEALMLPEPTDNLYEEAWIKCSWEVVAFAVAVLVISDGENEKGIFAFFSSLLNPELQDVCTISNERAISSRVGRTAVICSKIGNFRLMEIAIRRKDQVKRVYLEPKAKEILLKLLHGDWNKSFETYLIDNGKDHDYFQKLLTLISQ